MLALVLSIRIIFKTEWIPLMKSTVHYIFWEIVGGGWFFLFNIKSFINYYGNAYSSNDQVLWQIELSAIDNILYYPSLIYRLHLGKIISILGIVIVFIFFVLYIKKYVLLNEREKIVILLLVYAILFPTIMLTISKNKNSAVISIIDGACILFILFLAEKISEKMCFVKNFFFFFFLIVGTVFFCLNCVSIRDDYSIQKQEGAIEINKIVGEYAKSNNKNDIKIIVDKAMDTVFNLSIKVWYYEMYGEGINVENAIEGMPILPMLYQFSENELKKGLEEADIIIVSETGYAQDSEYITDEIMDLYREDILVYAEDNMRKLGTVIYNGGIISVYGKEISTASIVTQWDDWLGKDNTSIFVCNDAEKDLLIIEGANEYTYDDFSVICESSNRRLPVVYTVEQGRYQIKIGMSECDDGESIIKLKFSKCFVPSEEFASTDARELSVRYPDNVYFK